MHGVNTNTAWCLVTVKDFKANAEWGAFSGWNSAEGADLLSIPACSDVSPALLRPCGGAPDYPHAQFQAPPQASLAWKRELPWFLSLIMLALVHTAAYQ